MKKQYFVLKVVMAENVIEALNKSRKLSVTEVYIHSGWLEKEKNNNYFEIGRGKIGFIDRKRKED